MKKVVFVVGILILLAGCSTPNPSTPLIATDAPSTDPALQSRIVFSSGRDGNVEVYIMNSDGSGQTRLTNSPTFDGAPDLSPEGTKIAYISDRDGNAEVYSMNLDGSGQTNLTNSPGNDTYPDWSPDGRQIVFDSNRDGNSEIYIMNADGTGQTRLTSNPANDYSAKWSPDGKKIAFTSDRNGNYDVYVMNTDGSEQVNISNHMAVDVSPTWSGDSQKIAFDSNREGHYDIYVMDSDGSNQTRLTFSEVDTFAYTDWSPDGEKILVNVHNGQNWDLYVMDPDGKNITELVSGPTDDIDARWGPGLTTLAGVGRPTITPLPAMASVPNVGPTSVPVEQMPTQPLPSPEPSWTPAESIPVPGKTTIPDVLKTPGSTTNLALTGWVEYYASGTVNLDQEEPTNIGQIIIFHDPDLVISGYTCQGCFVLEPAVDIQLNIPPEDINGSDIIFRTGETYEYLVRGYLADKTFSDFFMGNVPVFEVEYLERTK